jgi:1,4-dihydroxy-2-naphthoate octaprenyltransferase
LIGSLVALAVAGAIGLGLVLASPREILLIGFSGALLGFFYTAPPLRLGYRGFGEVIVFLCLGPLAALGAYAVTSGQLSLDPVWASIPSALTVTALLHANNLRDLDVDRQSGKRTLAVRIGYERALREYELLITAAQVATIALAVFVTPLAVIGLLTIPITLPLMRLDRSDPVDGRALMRQTASLNLRLAMLIALAFALSGAVGGSLFNRLVLASYFLRNGSGVG